MKIKKKEVAVTLGMMCLLLAFGISMQLKTTKSLVSTAGSTSHKEDRLRDEVLKMKEQYDHIYEDLEQAEASLEKERQVSISSDDDYVEKQSELKKINTYLGLTDVTGEGMTITLKDSTKSTLDPAKGLVHNTDLLAVVNELKNTGAEAISINGQRIVPTTSINCVGTVIQVNDEIVGSPFVIKAIGDPNRINDVMRIGGFIECLQIDGISVEAKKSDNLKIDKYNGVLNKKTIEVAK